MDAPDSPAAHPQEAPAALEHRAHVVRCTPPAHSPAAPVVRPAVLAHVQALLPADAPASLPVLASEPAPAVPAARR